MRDELLARRTDWDSDWLPPRHVFHDVTARLNTARRFAEWSIAERPLASLIIAFVTGGIVGWLVKRR